MNSARHILIAAVLSGLTGCFFPRPATPVGTVVQSPCSADVLPDPMMLTVIRDLSEAATHNLWPDFTIDDKVIILRSHQTLPSSICCFGSCTVVLSSDRLRRLRRPPENAQSIGYTFLEGEELRRAGLPGRSALLVDIGAKARNAQCVANTVLHEAFHLYYQAERDLAVPLELPYRSNLAELPAEHGRLGSRGYLTEAYMRDESTARKVEGEIFMLRDAVRAARAGKGEEARAWATQFLRARSERRQSPRAAPSDEDLWEVREGIPALVESRAEGALGRRQSGCSLLEHVVNESQWHLRPESSWFLITGGLQAALLDEINPSWVRSVFPGRSGEGRSLTQTLQDRIGGATP